MKHFKMNHRPRIYLGILIREIPNFSTTGVLRIDDGYSFGNSPINYSLKGMMWTLELIQQDIIC